MGRAQPRAADDQAGGQLNTRRCLRAAAYLWAAPNTLLGLAAGALVLAGGGRLRLVHGAAEFSGGRLGRLARRQRFCAITLGHVIVGTSARTLSLARRHEHVHVRQYERWGPLFLPAYAASSLWQVLRGRRAYLDNRFERQAYALPSPAVRAPACKPEPLRGLAACGSKPPLRPLPSPSGRG